MQLYKHNADTYTELLSVLREKDKCAIVQCTGSGKGAIATKLILDNMGNKKILLLAPQESILNNYMRNFGIGGEDNVLCQMYAGVCRKSIMELQQLGMEADILILDEYHRCGAEKTEPAVKVLMKTIISHGGKVVGLSATPKRFLDDGRDMTDELFDGICVNGVDLTLAIKKGILPVFTYIKARYGFTSEVKRYENYSRKNRSKGNVDEKKLSVLTNEDFYIRDIVKKETANVKGCQKWVVFCKGIRELNEMRYNIPKWFDKDIRLFEMHSDISKEENFKNYTAFCESHRPINVLLTVNKLNEGVHIKGISGVIMLRETESPIIFLQQLGRALEAGATQRPIIFDFVNNVESLSKYGDDELVNFQLQIMAKEINDYAERKAKKDALKGGKIVLKSYCEDIDNILKDIRKVTRVAWLPEEDEVLKNYFNTEKKDITRRLPGRSWDAIYQRAKSLGLVKSREWTLKQDNIIKRYYPIEGEGVVARLEGRTEDAVKARASKLGVKKDKTRCWTEIDDNLLRIRYENGTVKFPIERMIKILDNRFTTEQIYQRLKYLGFNIASTERWTPDEDKFLEMVWGYMDMDEIERRLPRHTRQAIDREASYLGLQKAEAKGRRGSGAGDGWSESDIETLIELYNEHGKECFHLFAPRTERAVEQEITKLRKDLRYKDRFIR